MVQQKRIRLGTIRLQVRSLALLSGLRIWCCHVLWCRFQMQLRSQVAIHVASSYSSGSTPRLGISVCCRCEPKKEKKKKKDKKKKNLLQELGLLQRHRFNPWPSAVG